MYYVADLWTVCSSYKIDGGDKFSYLLDVCIKKLAKKTQDHIEGYFLCYVLLKGSLVNLFTNTFRAKKAKIRTGKDMDYFNK